MRQKLATIVGLAFFAIVLLLAWGQTALAQSFQTGDNINTGQNQQINQTLFLAGRNIDVNSEVFGDVFCAGMNITVSGTVHGDVICAGQTVNVSGTVDGDVRLAGQTVTLSANVSGNATVGGQSFTLTSQGKVGGDLSSGSSDANINGAVGRDLAVGGQNVVLASSVGGNVQASTTNLDLTSTANVAGNIQYTSANELSQASGAVVKGEITRTEPKQTSTPKRGAVFGFAIGWFVYWFLAMLFAAMALALLFPRALQHITDQAMPQPWKALLVGAVAGLLAPALIVLLAITVIGIPLAILAALLWLVALLLSGPVFGYYLGRLILRDSRQPLLIMLAGASLLIVWYFLPILGFLGLIAAVWFGTGMILLEAFRRTPKPVYDLSKSKSGK